MWPGYPIPCSQLYPGFAGENQSSVIKVMHREFCLLIVFFAAFIFAPAEALACTCGDTPTACEAFGGAAAVFIGTAGEVARYEDGFLVRTETEIRVKEVFLGGVGATVTAETRGMGCEFGFEAGKDYLIYAGDSGAAGQRIDRFYSSSCGRTRLLSEASEDLKFLRKEKKGMSGSRIYGWVREDRTLDYSIPESQRRPPIKGFGLKVIGPSRTYELTTDKKGEYELGGLQGGRYFIELIATTEYYSEGHREEFYVNPTGCSANNFYLSRNRD